MPGRPAQPWFYAAKNAWNVWIGNRKVSLRVKGEKNKAEALKTWHRLMGGVGLTPESRARRATVQEVIDGFLADAEDRVSPECLRNYRKHLLPFAKKHGPRPAEALTVAEAEAYARKPDWSASYRNDILGSLVSAYRWADGSIISRNPLERLRKPARASRGAKAIIAAADHVRLCSHASPFFRAFLQLLWLTGARPGEIASLRAEDVDLAQGVAVLTEHKMAHLGKCRVVFLCPEAVSILRERIAERPQGLLFPGADGPGHRLSPASALRQGWRKALYRLRLSPYFRHRRPGQRRS